MVESPHPSTVPSPVPSPVLTPVSPWRRPARWAIVVAALVVAGLVGSLITGAVLVRRSWPETSGEINLADLDAEVQVLRDEAGIPQIYADTMHDLMLAQGYVHAQERFFEMDVRRHATSGRLAELFGESGLDSDRVVRTLGWREVAEEELTLLEPATRSALNAYAEGVNAWLEGRSTSEMSLEYTLLGIAGLDYRPEKWTPVDSLAWLKAMAWDLRGNLDDEIERALAHVAVGPADAEQLYPRYDAEEHAPAVEQGAVRNRTFDQDAAPTDATTRALAGVREAVASVPPLLGDGDGLGSNGWVVSGERTSTGEPILANDPHLGVSLPGVWMQVGLHCREITDDCGLDVAGFSFSGVPGVVIGHNADIAWGFTNLGADVTDLYLERINGDLWHQDGKDLPLTIREETIEVRGGEDETIRVRSTDHGPLLSDIADMDGEDLFDGLDDIADSALANSAEKDVDELGVSLAWTALEPRPTADALLALNLADDWDSFHEALEDFDVPGQNVVYADTDGHIGYQATGRVPVRARNHDGRLPVAGWRSANDWTGAFVPYDALPSVLDPDSGLVATANQAVIDPESYPPFLTTDWDQGYRSQRILERLEADDEVTPQDMADLQLDDWSAIGEMLTPYLLDIDLSAGYASDGQDLLADWNFTQGPGSPAAAYFNVVWREVLERTFADELPEAIEPDGSDRWFAVMESILPRARNHWWDDAGTSQVERRDDILTAAMVEARDEMTRLQSPDPDEWSWGALHELELESPTLGQSGMGLVESLFNRGGWQIGGGSSLVNATAWHAPDGYGVVTAPSMRMVVPLDDLDAARWINLTGVSGHAFHPHYADQTDLWAEGETLPWPFSEESVAEAADDTLTLVPTEG